MLSGTRFTATLVSATLLLTACQEPSSPDAIDAAPTEAEQSELSAGPGPVVVDGVTIFIGDHETGGAAPDALVMGTVSVVDNCLVVVESDGADGSVPVFPRGTVVETGPDGPVVRTPVGELAVGDVVGLGGGFTGGLDDLGACDGVVPAGGFSVFSVQ